MNNKLKIGIVVIGLLLLAFVVIHLGGPAMHGLLRELHGG